MYTSIAALLFIITSLTRLWKQDLNYPFVIRLPFVLLALVAHFEAINVSLRLPWQWSSYGHPSNTLQIVEEMPEPHKEVSWQEKVKHEMPGRGILSSSFFAGKLLAQSNQWVWSQLANHWQVAESSQGHSRSFKKIQQQIHKRELEPQKRSHFRAPVSEIMCTLLRTTEASRNKSQRDRCVSLLSVPERRRAGQMLVSRRLEK